MPSDCEGAECPGGHRQQRRYSGDQKGDAQLAREALSGREGASGQNTVIRMVWKAGLKGEAPPLVVLSWPLSRWADHAEILNSSWGILCATFGKKND